MAYKKTHRVRRRTKHQKRRSLKRKIVKSIKGTKRRGGGGPGDPPGFETVDLNMYRDTEFIVNRNGLEDGWKIDFNYNNKPFFISNRIQMVKYGGLTILLSSDELKKYNPWFGRPRPLDFKLSETKQ